MLILLDETATAMEEDTEKGITNAYSSAESDDDLVEISHTNGEENRPN